MRACKKGWNGAQHQRPSRSLGLPGRQGSVANIDVMVWTRVVRAAFVEPIGRRANWSDGLVDKVWLTKRG